MSKLKASKVYVRPDDTAVITCSNCCRQKILPVDSYRGRKSHIKVKCGCRNVFTVDLEFRKKFRKKTHLAGRFTNYSRKNIKGDIVVTNLSMAGLEFSTKEISKFRNGDEIEISFNLDNPERTAISKDAVVRDVREKTVGCEFVRSSQCAYEGPLGFYLMF